MKHDDIQIWLNAYNAALCGILANPGPCEEINITAGYFASAALNNAKEKFPALRTKVPDEQIEIAGDVHNVYRAETPIKESGEALRQEILAMNKAFCEDMLERMNKEGETLMPQCRSCKQNILWKKTDKGKNMPVDPESYSKEDLDESQIVLDETGHRCAVKNMDEDYQGLIWTTHWETCPSAEEHRK